MKPATKRNSSAAGVLCVLGVLCPSSQSDIANPTDSATQEMSYLDNGTIRLGVDLSIGGAIAYLADLSQGDNLINSHDWGRQVQMSFYSGPVPYLPNGKNPNSTWMGIGWNPIQSGDYAGYRSQVLEHTNDGLEIYVKCIPMHWPLDNEPGECTFESWIRLEENRVHARARIDNARSDTTQYPARGQELPAVYTNGPYYKVMSYTGDDPFTGGELEQFTKVWTTEKLEEGFNPWSHWLATEGWSALVNDDDWGLGVWSPETLKFTGGFYGKTRVGGPKDPSTGYLAPGTREILDHNIVYEYEYVLLVDSIQGIRDWVSKNHAQSRLPDYVFERDRQHCFYQNCADEGWPIEGELRIRVSDPNPVIVCPDGFWEAGEVPKLFIRMAYEGAATKGRIYWKNFQDRNRSQDRPIEFDLISDGEFHSYEIDLAPSPAYAGKITGIEIEPAIGAKEGETLRLKSISFRGKIDP